MNTNLDTYTRPESPSRRQGQSMLLDPIRIASFDAGGSLENTEEPNASARSPRSILRASLAPLSLKPTNLTQHTKYSGKSASDNADIERNEQQKPHVGSSHPSKTSN